MAKINMNEVARKVTLSEGGKSEANIAETKQILSIFLSILANYRPSQVMELLERPEYNILSSPPTRPETKGG